MYELHLSHNLRHQEIFVYHIVIQLHEEFFTGDSLLSTVQYLFKPSHILILLRLWSIQALKSSCQSVEKMVTMLALKSLSNLRT